MLAFLKRIPLFGPCGRYRDCLDNHTRYRAGVEEVVQDVVRSFFDRIKRIPEASQYKAAMRRDESAQAKALADTGWGSGSIIITIMPPSGGAILLL